MALFGSKKSPKTENTVKTEKTVKSVKAKTAKTVKPEKTVKTETKTAAKPTSAVAVVGNTLSGNIAGVIIRPRITEKSGILSQNGVYTFEVTKFANKNTVSKAINALYKITPVRVAMINLPAKNVFVRGRWGRVPGIKKAVITLKKGDKIDFV